MPHSSVFHCASTHTIKGPKTQGLPSFLPTSLPSDLVQTGNSGSRGASASSFGQSERVGLSSWEKERVLAQYDCESDEEYPFQ